VNFSEYTGAHPTGSPVEPAVVSMSVVDEVTPEVVAQVVDDEVDDVTSVVPAPPVVGPSELPPVEPDELPLPVTTVGPPVAPDSPSGAPPAHDTSNNAAA
jgi:hypothetical protein